MINVKLEGVDAIKAKIRTATSETWLSINGAKEKDDLAPDDMYRKETERLYGLSIRNGLANIIANGEEIPLYLPPKYEYGHDFHGRFSKLENSGIEIETDNLWSTLVVGSLVNYVMHELQFPVSDISCYYDGSLNTGGAEFKLSLLVWTRLLERRLIKSSLKFQSTHIHVSAPAILYKLISDRKRITSLINNMTSQKAKYVFGRDFHERFAYQNVVTYLKDRYAGITLPPATVERENVDGYKDEKVFIDVYDENKDGCVSWNENYIFEDIAPYRPTFFVYGLEEQFENKQRVTAEFRVTRILNYATLMRFLRWLCNKILEIPVAHGSTPWDIFNKVNKISEELISSGKFGAVKFSEEKYSEPEDEEEDDSGYESDYEEEEDDSDYESDYEEEEDDSDYESDYEEEI